MAGNWYLQRYNALRNSIAAGQPDTVRARALAQFDADPRVQPLRRAAGLAAVSTAKGEVRQAAKQSLAQQGGQDIGQNATRTQSASAGIARGMFGIPEILAAAGERFLPTAITGNRTNASFNNILQMVRAKDTAAIDAHPGYGLAGELGGGIVGGGAAGKVLKSLPGVGRVATAVGTLKKGQRVANVGRLAAIGASGGGAQAAGTGEDPIVGAVEGAVAAPVVAGGAKLAGVITRPFRDFLQMTQAPAFLRRLTTATAQQLQQRAAEYRAATGAEPTLFELLPQVDRQKLLNQGLINPKTAEQASTAIKARAENLGPEMADVTTKALQPGRDQIRTGIVADLTKARGGALQPGDDELIDAAMKSPTDMEKLRSVEASAIMAPHKDTPVAHNLVDILPTMPGPNGSKIDIDPEVSNIIRAASGSLRLRKPGEPITADEVTDIMQRLRTEAGKGGIEGATADTALQHLQQYLHGANPDAGAAAQAMNDAFAARSRMLEGMKAGNSGQLRDNVQIGTSGRQARLVRNAFDTPEGQAGLALGHGNSLESDLGGSPDEALRATIGQSRGSTSRELAQNVGDVPAEQITTAAKAQDQSAQALASAARTANSPDEAGSGEGLVQALVGLHPGSFATTKAWSVRKLMDLTYIPANRAKTIVDMLFSQDPTITRKAIAAVGNEPNGAGFLKGLAGVTGIAAGGKNAGEPEASEDAAPSATLPAPGSAADNANAPADDPYADVAAPAPAASAADPYADVASTAEPTQNSPYAERLSALRQSENPDLIELSDRVENQESRGNQHAVSKKGAVGLMQVEPTTGPEAAAAAGVPWDPKAFVSDAAYNKLLGTAYLSKLLVKYQGSVPHALAAYNAGPGNVDKALSTGDNWLTALPAETQDYVARVGT